MSVIVGVYESLIIYIKSFYSWECTAQIHTHILSFGDGYCMMPDCFRDNPNCLSVCTLEHILIPRLDLYQYQWWKEYFNCILIISLNKGITHSPLFGVGWTCLAVNYRHERHWNYCFSSWEHSQAMGYQQRGTRLLLCLLAEQMWSSECCRWLRCWDYTCTGEG